MREGYGVMGVVLVGVVAILSITAFAQPLLFLGDVSKLTPLECVDRQCSMAGLACARNCPDSLDEKVCQISCKGVFDRCLESRCFFNLRVMARAQAFCCEDNKFGCRWDDSKGCLDSLQRSCGGNKGFNESFTECVNANLTLEQGNATLNFSSQTIPELDGTDPCFDSSECSGNMLCYKGSCVITSEITPMHRISVECLDDADCPPSTLAPFVCLNSTCLVKTSDFCRAQTDCPPPTSCRDLHCVSPKVEKKQEVPLPVDPAIAALQSWAKAQPGLLARVSSVAGRPVTGTAPEVISPGRFFSQGDSVSVPDGMAIEMSLADGSRAFAGPGARVTFTSIAAKGADLSINLALTSGELILDVPQLHEVSRQVRVVSEFRQVAIQKGVVSVVDYPEHAMKLASVDGTVSIDGLSVPAGMEVVVDPSGVKRPQVKIPSEEVKRLEKASQSPSPIPPPPYARVSFLDRYGVLAVGIAIVLILALWMFWRRRPKGDEKDDDGSHHSGISWQERESETEEEPPRLDL